MSKERKDLSNKEEDILSYIKLLLNCSFVKNIYIKGSRSTLSKKQPRKDSDWDLEIITDNKVFFTNPRKLGLHVDLHYTKTPSNLSVEWNKIINNG